MKQKYRIAALLGALAMLSACAVEVVHAEDENHWGNNTSYISADGFTELDDGSAGIRLHEVLDGFVVITDMEGLDESLFGDCNLYEESSNPEWVQKLPVWMQNNDNRYFVVDTTPTIYRDESYCIQIPYSKDVIRHIMLEADNIREIVTVSRDLDGIVQWDGDFVGVIPTGYPENSRVEGSVLSGYAEALEELNSADLSGYALLCAAFGKAEELDKKNPDKCNLVFPTVTTTGIAGTAEYSYADIWDGVGNVDGLNGTDASDAAEILIAAAAYGAEGKYDDFDLYYGKKCIADVNADGQIDADDAAIVLQYAAAIGAGQDHISIRDFIP